MRTRTPKTLRRQYDRIFRKDPASANLFLLLTEIADQAGRVRLSGDPAEALAVLMAKRFDDPMRYQL